MKKKMGMFQVLARKGKREFFDYIKRSRLTNLVKTGYVVGIPSLSLKEAKELFDSGDGIIVTFDGVSKMVRFEIE